jgi:hypothetical protein
MKIPSSVVIQVASAAKKAFAYLANVGVDKAVEYVEKKYVQPDREKKKFEEPRDEFKEQEPGDINANK